MKKFYVENNNKNYGNLGRCKSVNLQSIPKTLMCFICGRHFGTKSLKFHIKSCYKKQ